MTILPTIIAAVLPYIISPDLDGDLDVDGADYGLLLGAWGTPAADINGDGTTDGADLGLLLGEWSGSGLTWREIRVEPPRRWHYNGVTVPAGARVQDAETVYGPLWRGIWMLSWDGYEDEYGQPVYVFWLPEDWIPEDRIRVDALGLK